MHVRVLTFNVWNSEGDPRRIDLINRGLRELDPDLVALQEVSAAPAPDQLERLLAGTNLQGTHQAQVVAVPPPGAERYGGNAIATRWPHRIVEALDLRQAGAPDVPWCTLAARVSLPELGDLFSSARQPRGDSRLRPRGNDRRLRSAIWTHVIARLCPRSSREIFPPDRQRRAYAT